MIDGVGDTGNGTAMHGPKPLCRLGWSDSMLHAGGRVPRDLQARRGRHAVACGHGRNRERGRAGSTSMSKRAWRAQLFMRFLGDFDGGQGRGEW